jgi:hypothetical protein
MTAARRLGKVTAALLLIALGLVMVRTALVALVINPATGLALSGIGPVAYFSDGKAQPGHQAYELVETAPSGASAT